MPDAPTLVPRPSTSAALTLSSLLAAAALALGACGGGDAGPDPVEPGAPGASPGSPEFGDHVVRVPGLSETDVASAAILTAYPPREDAAPNGWILFPTGDWRRAVTAAQFAAEPIGGALLPVESDYLPTAAADVTSRIRPEGLPRADDLAVLILGKPGPDLVTELQDLRLKLTVIRDDDPSELSATVVPYRGGWAAAYSDAILIVSASAGAREYALPAAAWSAFSGDTVAFVDGGLVPAATRSLVAQREDLRKVKPTVYLVGPESVIPESVAAELAPFAEEVRRIDGQTPAAVSVELARMLDRDTGVGWGFDEAPVNLSFVNEGEGDDAVGALTLAAAGPRAAPLLVPDSDRLPQVVAAYLRELRDGAANRGWVLGDRQSVSSSLLAEIDELLGPAPAKGKKGERQGRRQRQGRGENGEGRQDGDGRGEGRQPEEPEPDEPTGGAGS